ncbi:polyamine ABC transporter substrate-binding protein [Crenobacter luteus]|uniref:Putrescine-binding periplasmic protein n=1 Tax=Crenobacter luteus TaxID=1452487 RepID=A0A161SBU4_9NEIS|nr:polyamine ABC transporter substrate-binding protein [Crenobacter luteus]KZE33523.1 spermidine/putrescine ABC transporter substrate-binding protein [Crenobacter luteus]
MRQRMFTVIAASVLAASAGPALAAGKVLNVYNWSDYIAPETVKNFEKETGIKVRYDVYDSNEVLQAKILTGRSGYDIVVPTNAFLAKQIKAGIYQPIDKSKIANYKHLDAAVMAQAAKFDPGNAYSVPYFYGINTLAINVGKVKAALGSLPMPANEWDLLFKPEYAARLKSCGVSVLDSPAEALPMAAHYLGRNPNSNADADWRAAAELFKQVRPYITRFSSSGYINEFANGSLCVVLGYGGDLNIARRRAEEARNGQQLKVLAPKAGVMLWMDSMAIPKDAQNVDNAYAFIDYVMRPEVAAANARAVSYATPNRAARARLDAKLLADASIYPTAEIQQKSFVQLPQDAKIQRLQTRLWTEVKTRK